MNSYAQLHRLQELIASITEARAARGTAELDEWRLDLTCDHSVLVTAHRSHASWTTRVVACPTCQARRGVVHTHRVGPANDPDGDVQRQRTDQRLQTATAKLARQRAALAKTEREVQQLADGLGETAAVAT